MFPPCRVDIDTIIGKTLSNYQNIEYARSFTTSRIVDSLFNSVVIISGAVGIFRTDVVKKVGGYTERGCLAEDMDLNLRLQKYIRNQKVEGRIYYDVGIVAETQPPYELKSMFNQRKRWHQGARQCLFISVAMIFNPRYGYLGMVALPRLLIFELVQPVVEVLTLILLFEQESLPLWLPIIIIVLLLGVNRLFANNTKETIICTIFEVLLIHPFLSFCKIAGLVSFNNRWGKMKREKLEPIKEND